jgi:ABC-2 type transport system ATP-binding protein
MSEATLPAIELESLTKVFRSGQSAVRAVDAISVRMPAGQVFGLLGPNGAGKTTTIKLICGLVTPTEGSVRVNGYDIRRQRPEAVVQLGAVLEGGRNVYWSLSAWQNLFYFGRLKGLSGGEIRPRAERLLRDLDLWRVRNFPVGGFSRGMQQKVAVAAALITDPPIVLLDEPTIGLDVEAARTVKDWILALAHEQGKTVLLTTHQLDMAQALCDRVAIIIRGRIAADLPVDELLRSFRQDHRRIVLDGTADLSGAALPEGARVTHEGETTVLEVWNLDDQAVYPLLDRLGRTGRRLISVVPVQPDLEDVFLALVRDGATVG